ncbi:MAG: sigma-70 family RNA polymerase sigma factor [Chloroflexales bacterium]|nr:sigma-70 family RNA polymerase sigma factor [Chloroflexales bacterium]
MAGWEANLSEVLARAQRGDQRAFDLIYHRFADPLFRYIYARSGDASQAEELHGDLWLRVVERLGSFRPPPSGVDAAFAAWLYRIAYNMVIDSVRRRGGPGVSLDIEIVSHDPAPDEQIIVASEAEALHAAIERLTPDQREVVVMRFFEERSNAEVAALTGRSEGAVKVMQHRALKTLARLLGIERQ